MIKINYKCSVHMAQCCSTEQITQG